MMDAGSVLIRIMADSTGLTAGLNKASGQLAAFSKKASVVGMAMTKFLTVPILGLGAVAAVSAVKFEKSMTLIQTQCGASARDVEILSKAVLDLGRKGEHGPQELAAALYHLKSVGMENVDAVKALTAAEKLAAVSGADMEETTNALAGAWKTGIKGAGDFGNTVATLNSIVGAGNLRMGELNAALGTGVLDSAKAAGLSLTDVGAALALFTSHGQPAVASATRLRMAFSMMSTPTGAAVKAFKKIGLEQYDLATTMRTKGLIPALQELKDHLETSGLTANEQADVIAKAFGGARTGVAINTLLNGLDQIAQKEQQIKDGIGGFADAVEAEAKSAAAKWEHFMSVMKTVSVQFGNVLLPAITDVAEKIGNLAEKFGNLSPKTQELIVKILAVVAAVGPAIFFLGKFVGIVGGLAHTIVPLIPLIGAFFAAFKVGGLMALVQSILAATGPLGWIVLAIGAVTTAVILLYTKCEWFRDAVAKVWEFVKKVFWNAVDAILPVVQKLWDELLKGAKWLQKTLGPALTELWQAALPIIKAVIELIIAQIQLFISAVRKAVEFIRDHWSTIGPIVKDALRVCIDALKTFFKVLADVIKLVAALLRGDWSDVWKHAKEVVKDAVTGILKVLGDLNKLGIDIMVAFARGLASGWQKVSDWLWGLTEKIMAPFIWVLKKLHIIGGDSAENYGNGFGAEADGKVVPKLNKVATTFLGAFNALPEGFSLAGAKAATSWLKSFTAGLDAGVGPIMQGLSSSMKGSGGTSTGAKLVAWAEKKTSGYYYKWGGESPASGGFDCSGLVYYVYKHFGYNLPRVSSLQSKVGRPVAMNNLQPGDLIFFWTKDGPQPGHVGIYVRPGVMYAASHTGAKLAEQSYEGMNVAFARRVLPDQKGTKATKTTPTTPSDLGGKTPSKASKTSKTGASTVSGPATTAIKDLVDWVSGIADSLRELAKQKKVKLPSGWRSMVESIAKEAGQVANVVAKTLDKVLGSKKNMIRLAKASELVSPIQGLIEFVIAMGESLKELKTIKATSLTGWQSEVKAIVNQVTAVSKMVSNMLYQSFGGKRNKTAAKKLAEAAVLTGPMGEIIDFLSNVMSIFASMTEQAVKDAIDGVQRVERMIANTMFRGYLLAIIYMLDDIFKDVSITNALLKTTEGALALVSNIAGVITTFADMTAERVNAAIEGVKLVERMLAKTMFVGYLLTIIYMIDNAFTGVTVQEAITKATSDAVALVGDISNIITTFADMTAETIDNSVVAFDYAVSKTPLIADAMKRLIQALAVNLVGVTASDEFTQLVKNIASVVSDVASILQSLVTMTGEAIDEAIKGAGWVSYKAMDLAEALKKMVAWLDYALVGVSAGTLEGLRDKLNMLGEVATAISGIVTTLSELTNEKLTLATAAGASLGSGFYSGLLSWHKRIVDEARQIAADVAAALAGQATTTTAPPTADAITNAANAANNAANAANNAANAAETISVKVSKPYERPPWAQSLVKLQEGGIVTRPTLAIVGERGPEAVLPLRRGLGGCVYNVVVNIANVNATDPQQARASSRFIAREVIQQLALSKRSTGRMGP